MISACNALLLTVVAAGIDVDVSELDGTLHAGQLLSVSTDEIVLQTIEGSVTLPTRKLFALTPMLVDEDGALPESLVVDLVDGSELHCERIQIESGRAMIEFPEGEPVNTLSRSIRAVRFKKQNADLQRQWEEIEASKASADLLVLRKTVESTDDDGVDQVVANLDPLEGVVYAIDDDKVDFEFDGTRIEVPRQKVEGVIYFRRSSSRQAESVCRVIDRSQTAWHVKSLQLKEGVLKGVSAGGVRVSLPIAQLAKIDFAIGNLVFLSDLTAESIEWIPKIQSRATPASVKEFYQPQTDRGFYGGPLMLDAKSYQKGLSLHSRTTMSYRLTREFRRFAATVGIDDRFRADGNVTLTISGDGEELLLQRISGDHDPVQLDVNLEGVRRLTILVDFGDDNMQVGDYLNLCNARLMK
jgi:hypothetical protein